jgi:signal peptidase I
VTGESGEPPPPEAADIDQPSPEGGAPPPDKRKIARSWWIELPVLLCLALALALIIKSFGVQAFFIPSSSMENTLDIGDKVLVNKIVYHVRPIDRGDIVVFNGDGSWDAVPAPTESPLVRLWDAITGLFGTAPGVHDYIKRVIGIPGDHVACCDRQGRVTVNGVPLNETSYLHPGNPPSRIHFSVTVPPGRLWVMGDHRDVSADSRAHTQDPGNGTIPESRVVGRAFMIIYPFSRWRVLPIPATFQQPRLAGMGAGGEPAAGVSTAVPPGVAAMAPALPARAVPLGLGFAAAVPMTLFQRRVRRRFAPAVRRRLGRFLRRRFTRPARRGTRARQRAESYRGMGCRAAGENMHVPALRHPGYTPRRGTGLSSYERVLARAGLSPVAGIDEAGRGACAGPLVVAAVALDTTSLARLQGVADSKALTAAAREEAYKEVVGTALGWNVVVIPSREIDAFGLHVCNIAGMRRALAGLSCRPAYALTDGFPVRGLGVPALAMWKGDEVATCVAAASVVAKVTRDLMMRDLHTRYPEYGFARHKGYSTPGHMRALTAHGPCPEHRLSFVNVGSIPCEDPGLEN